MRYLSTRGYDNDGAGVSFTSILLEGLAPDGGLYLPQHYPQVDQQTLRQWRTVLGTEGYAALACAVMGLYIDDIPQDDLRRICERAYAPERFEAADPTQLVPATQLSDGLWLGHLSQGPTAAFKDMAMQVLGEFFSYELKRRGQVLNIVGATSGDTGSAAEYAMKGRDEIRVFMLTPAGRMTPFQQAQMFSLDDEAVVNIAVQGVFDDCQDIVKAIGADLDFKREWSIGAVNSINWARLLAQVVYYVALWLRVSEVAGEEPVNVAVPTGNFGDICAGHIARRMGVPINRLLCATNENDVLDEFFRTGVYRPRSSAETVETSSPSMDISRASNFERYIFDLLGRDSERTSLLFHQLIVAGHFDLAQDPAFARIGAEDGFLSTTSTHAQRLSTIAQVHDEEQIIIDPHTADAVTGARRAQAEGLLPGHTVALETALPVKFSQTITEALGHAPEVPERFAGIETLPHHVIDAPNDAAAIRRIIEERALHAR